MTCIVGVEHKGSVWMGGDSAATDNSFNRTIIKDPKVFIKNNVGFGVCGLPKVMDAVAHGLEIPTQKSGQTDRQFLVSTLVPALREGLERFDCIEKHPEYGSIFHGSMLIGYRGKVYDLQSNFQFVHNSEGFASAGSGGELAKGSLISTKGMSNPKKRILTALQVSTANAGVAPPFVVIQVKKNG